MKWLGTISLLFFAVIAISIGYMNYSRMSEKWQNCTADTEGIIVDFDSEISMSGCQVFCKREGISDYLRQRDQQTEAEGGRYCRGPL